MRTRSLIILFVLAGLAVALAAALALNADPTDSSVATDPVTTIATTTASTPAEDPITTTAAPEATTTIDTTTTTQALPSTTTLPDGVAVCDLYTEVQRTGTIGSADLVEASGTAASRLSPGVVWAHNDSGDRAAGYAVGPEGEDLGTFRIPGATAFDWEDMAAGPGPDESATYLYFGDIGDNFGIRAGRITVYRVPEADPTGPDDILSGVVAIPFRYPDGAYDAEALFVDPVDGALYVVTKDHDQARVFRGNGFSDGATVETMEVVTDLDVGAQVTGADISWDGSTIALRGYEKVWMWHRTPGATIADTLEDEPCTVPSPDEPQGESIAFMDDDAYITISEGENPPLHRVDREG
jgi:hypothetical protein